MLRRDQLAFKAAEADGDEGGEGVAASKKKGKGRGRGKGRGKGKGNGKGKGKGKGKGEGKGKDAKTETETPKKKPSPKLKRSPKAKASPKKLKKASPKKKTSKRKTDQSDEPEIPPPKKAKKGHGKGEKVGDEGGEILKSFARRARPSSSNAGQKWDAIRTAFNEEIRPQVTAASVHEDRNHLGQEIARFHPKGLSLL